MIRHRYSNSQKYHLSRDRRRKKLGGVCAGLARYLGVQPLFIRIVSIIALVVAAQPTLIAYGIAYFVLDDMTDREAAVDLDWDEFED